MGVSGGRDTEREGMEVGREEALSETPKVLKKAEK